MDQSTLKIGVGVVIVPCDFRGVWMRRRINCEDYDGLWEVPGGKVEATDASLAAAAQRECREETGIDLPVYHVLIDDVFEKPSGQKYRSVQFAQITDETPHNVNLDRGSEWVLIPFTHLPKYHCFGSIQALFRTK